MLLRPYAAACDRIQEEKEDKKEKENEEEHSLFCVQNKSILRPHAIAYKKKKKKKKKKKTKTKTKKKTNTLLSARACPPKVEGV